MIFIILILLFRFVYLLVTKEEKEEMGIFGAAKEAAEEAAENAAADAAFNEGRLDQSIN